MSKFDISKNLQAHDRLLETLENPLHRQIIENYRRHALLEVMGYWEDIFAPDMTVENPVYHLNFLGLKQTLVGDEVKQFYKNLAESGGNAIVVNDEVITVGDDGFGNHAYFTHFWRGSQIIEMGYKVDDPEAWYSFTYLLISYWPYDKQGRMIGEWGGDVGEPVIEKIDESDVVTVEHARKALGSQLRPLPSLLKELA